MAINVYTMIYIKPELWVAWKQSIEYKNINKYKATSKNSLKINKICSLIKIILYIKFNYILLEN